MSLLSKPNRPCWVDGNSGEVISQSKVIHSVSKRSVVFLGETHDRADHHQWQLEVSENIFRHRTDIALGFEMFPKRVQPIVDKWARDQISMRSFLNEVDWDSIWGFNSDLYRPIFQFCKDNKLPMIALNCNRALVTDIGKNGWNAVDPATLEGLSPAKEATRAYRQYLFDITGGNRPGRTATHAEDPAFDRFVRAQQVWDRAFACNLNVFHKRHPKSLLIALIGSGHLEFGGGTPYQLSDLGINNSTILLPTDEENSVLGIGDFIYQL